MPLPLSTLIPVGLSGFSSTSQALLDAAGPGNPIGAMAAFGASVAIGDPTGGLQGLASDLAGGSVVGGFDYGRRALPIDLMTGFSVAAGYAMDGMPAQDLNFHLIYHLFHPGLGGPGESCESCGASSTEASLTDQAVSCPVPSR